MTMIARLDLTSTRHDDLTTLRAYIADELVGVAEPIMVDDQPLYFLTIQSDRVGTLRFETEDGTLLTPSPSAEGRGEAITYVADSHHGSLNAPVLLRPAEDATDIYKIIENDHVVIIRGGERYDVTGIRLAK